MHAHFLCIWMGFDALTAGLITLGSVVSPVQFRGAKESATEPFTTLYQLLRSTGTSSYGLAFNLLRISCGAGLQVKHWTHLSDLYFVSIWLDGLSFSSLSVGIYGKIHPVATDVPRAMDFLKTLRMLKLARPLLLISSAALR
ncbi:hypothetical protein OE88DRAFT_574473 [Heliocybe sulcata]|uniref:Uncharacterized protein n=1 Tax=Heliocybe sulcata TaxID=5364 RepID=A0A5C3MTD2_9AGAM|nr:hypothetical protein OE88DRAFT_574473 [Heliocybe sulcata]